MKKIFSIILSIVMLLSLSLNTFAVDTASTILTYSNEASYEISIPDSVSIDTKTLSGEININILNAKLEKETLIQVSVESENEWKLVSSDKVGEYINYSLSLEDKIVENGDRVIFTDTNIDTKLKLQIEEAKVGQYSDILTFTSEIIRIIPFIVDEDNYYSEVGMTWADWINSDYNTSTDNYGYTLVINDNGNISKLIDGNMLGNVYKERLCLTKSLYTEEILVNYEYFWE